MKILISSSTFLPNMGGLEQIMSGLAEQFVAKGHEVAVLTTTQADTASATLTYPVFRKPNSWEIFQQYRKADVILEANISLKTLAFAMLFLRKWFVVHHIHYQHGKGLLPYLKNFFTFFAANIAVSNFIKTTLWGEATTIPNFYSADFRKISGSERKNDFIFVGRWVSDKGGDLLLEAMAALKEQGHKLNCTFVGRGPEEPKYRKLVVDLNLTTQVHFAGPLRGEALVQAYNSHQVAVIPSTWQEPFGLVLLEALACGCKVVASKVGGLPEAGAAWAHYAVPGDVADLATAMLKAYQHQQSDQENSSIAAHLQEHQDKRIAKLYLDYFKERLGKKY